MILIGVLNMPSDSRSRLRKMRLISSLLYVGLFKRSVIFELNEI